MNPFAVCAFAVAAACIIASLKALRPDFAMLAVALCGTVVFVYILDGISPFISFLKDVADGSGVAEYFRLMIKALAISLCCRMSADICRDCGEASLASRVELAGKVSIVVTSIPIVEQLFDIAKDLMQ